MVIDAKTYSERRRRVRVAAPGGLLLFLGHRPISRNYTDNVFPFRQNSHFLYFTGISRPDLALVITAEGEGVLFGRAEDIDDVVWHGPHESLQEAGGKAGLTTIKDLKELPGYLSRARAAGAKIRYLPPFQASGREWLEELVEMPASAVTGAASTDLVRAVTTLRSVKSPAEVAEIEEALSVTAAMHLEAMRVTRPGLLEAEVAAAVQAVALSHDRAQCYNPIVTIHGEVLHNESYHHRLAAGHLLLNDSGAESARYYASDITRTFPVSGRFSSVQRDIYQVVLDTQLGAIAAVKPGVRYRDVHLAACRIMVEGLKGIGLMQGSSEDAVAAGAHALFFPHGLGHMLGLDVHDMEDLGDIVGYPEGEARSSQFGLNFLRLSKTLEPGFVLTVEPGIYMIPALIDRWREEGRHRDFIRYDRLEGLRDFGGLRTEDDVLVTSSGGRVLGPAIPKTVEEVEAAMAA